MAGRVEVAAACWPDCAADVRASGIWARVVVGCIGKAAAETVTVSVVVTGVGVAVVVLVSVEMMVDVEGVHWGFGCWIGVKISLTTGGGDGLGEGDVAALAELSPLATAIPCTRSNVDWSRSSISLIWSRGTGPEVCLPNMLVLGHTYFARPPRSGTVTCDKRSSCCCVVSGCRDGIHPASENG